MKDNRDMHNAIQVQLRSRGRYIYTGEEEKGGWLA